MRSRNYMWWSGGDPDDAFGFKRTMLFLVVIYGTFYGLLWLFS